jgi:hypothetical protein
MLRPRHRDDRSDVGRCVERRVCFITVLALVTIAGP